ncbi:1-3-beta-glucan synthase component FKS1 [Penicillium hispanicum]|uniref:1-3-beta-glucan synthase component FKS1 n=1 Tax=Penicillium hispanicum TaxID=1080232 RepID=UPI0025404949|nr:1-3-beta-glucan synthase component FKS1 [Penicillium hispanicum]KAJ5570539.1 1-3-beta-glucan synthase component FKS1 [Penicillium hispanicum]
MYFCMLVLFVILLAAPLVVHDLHIDKSFLKTLWDKVGVKSGNSMYLLQPLDHGLNDTQTYYTGSHLPAGYDAASSLVNPTTAGAFTFARML